MRKLALSVALSFLGLGCSSSGGNGGVLMTGGRVGTGTGGAEQAGTGGAQGAGTGGSVQDGSGGASFTSSGGAGGTGSGGLSSPGGATTGGAGGTRSGGAGGAAGVTAGATGGVAAAGGAAGRGTGGLGGGGAAGAAGGAPPGSGCGTRPYKLCEDFESADPGGLPAGWMQFELYTTGKPGTVNVQTDQFHGGAKSLKSSSDAKDQPRVRRSLASLGMLANNHWGRIFYKVQTPAPRPNTYFHVTFAALTKEPAAPESRVVDTVQDPTGKLQYLYNLPDDTCCTMTGFSGGYDANWHCAEWYISQTTNSFRFFQDGQEIPISFNGNTKARIANIAYIALGTAFYQLPASPFVAWIDDLAINDTQIGCGP